MKAFEDLQKETELDREPAHMRTKPRANRSRDNDESFHHHAERPYYE